MFQVVKFFTWPWNCFVRHFATAQRLRTDKSYNKILLQLIKFPTREKDREDLSSFDEVTTIQT